MRRYFAITAVALLALSFWRVPAAHGVEPVVLPPQVPPRTASGATNITDVWLHGGGGRLYWNTLVAPRQIALEGARFADPAAVPELAVTPQPVHKAPVRRVRHRKVKVSKAAPHAATSPAPKGVGKTTLRPPAAQSSAIPPLTAPAGGSAPQTAGAMPTQSMRSNAVVAGGVPYSSLPASPTGSVSGAAQAAPAQPPTPDVPMPPSIPADAALPGAAARP